MRCYFRSNVEKEYYTFWWLTIASLDNIQWLFDKSLHFNYNHCIHPWVDLLLIMNIPWVDNAAWFHVLPTTIPGHDPSLGLLITLKHKEYLMFLRGMVFVLQEFLWIKSHTFASSLDVYATLVISSKFVLVIVCESWCCFVGIFENVCSLVITQTF